VAPLSCPTGYDSWTDETNPSNHVTACYKYVASPAVNGADATAACTASGGSLANVLTASETNHIYSLVDTDNAWVYSGPGGTLDGSCVTQFVQSSSVYHYNGAGYSCSFQYSYVCKAAKDIVGGITECSDCGVGTYSTQGGAHPGISSACTACPSGKFMMNQYEMGNSLVLHPGNPFASCLPCTASHGYASPGAGAEFEGLHSDDARGSCLCAAGFGRDTDSALATTDCLPCTPGKYHSPITNTAGCAYLDTGPGGDEADASKISYPSLGDDCALEHRFVCKKAKASAGVDEDCPAASGVFFNVIKTLSQVDCYYFSNIRLSYTNAAASCADNSGSHLVNIDTVDEGIKVWNNLELFEHIWIGSRSSGPQTYSCQNCDAGIF